MNKDSPTKGRYYSTTTVVVQVVETVVVVVEPSSFTTTTVVVVVVVVLVTTDAFATPTDATIKGSPNKTAMIFFFIRHN